MPSDNSRRYLLYTIANYSIKELNLMQYLLKSLAHFSKKSVDRFDLMIVANPEFQKELATLPVVKNKTLNILFALMPKQDAYLEDAKMRRYDIFDMMPPKSQYAAVMHIDHDCIVQKDVVAMLDSLHLRKGVFYSYAEGGNLQHMEFFYGLQDYSEEDLQFFKEHDIRPFSTGLFVFVPCKTMAKHFDAIKRMQEAGRHRRHFYDLGYVNKHFNLLNKANTSELTKYVMARNIVTNLAGIPTLRNTLFDKLTVVNHFCGIGYYDERQLRMRRFWKFLKSGGKVVP